MIACRHLSLASDDIDREILHCGVENFFHRARKAVHLIDEEHIAGVKIGEQRGKIAGLFNRRTGRDADVDAELIGNDGGKRRFTQSGRAVQQYMQ